MQLDFQGLLFFNGLVSSFPELIPPNDPVQFNRLVDAMADTVSGVRGRPFYLGFSYNPETEDRGADSDPKRHFDDYPNDPTHIDKGPNHIGAYPEYFTLFDLHHRNLFAQGVTPVFTGRHRQLSLTEVDSIKAVDVWHFNEAAREKYKRLGEISVRSRNALTSHDDRPFSVCTFFVESAGTVKVKNLLLPKDPVRQAIDNEVEELATYLESQSNQHI